MTLDKVFTLVKRSALDCEKIATNILGKYDITLAQFKVIEYVYYSPKDSVRLMDLESYFSLTHPTAIGIVQNLEKKGLVIRKKDEEHSRIRYITLTEKGMKIQDDLTGAGEQIEDELTKTLTAKERQQLIRLLRKMQGVKDVN